jgi:hypothetical protein
MADDDNEKPQVTQSSNSNEPISPLDIRSVSPLAPGGDALSKLAASAAAGRVLTTKLKILDAPAEYPALRHLRRRCPEPLRLPDR